MSFTIAIAQPLPAGSEPEPLLSLQSLQVEETLETNLATLGVQPRRHACHGFSAPDPPRASDLDQQVAHAPQTMGVDLPGEQVVCYNRIGVLPMHASFGERPGPLWTGRKLKSRTGFANIFMRFFTTLTLATKVER